MKIFGLEISWRKKAAQPLTSVTGYRWWDRLWGPVSESTTGAWQRNIVAVRDTPTLLSSSTVYACVTGIATDVAKLPLLLMRQKGDIWEEVEEDSPFLPVLRKPNHYQVRIKFIEQWVVSKLLHGNTYVLKQRDQRGIVEAMYILHPLQVTPMVAENGELFYQLKRDQLSQVFPDMVTVPASEIIHDSMVGMWHPLVGVSPLFACAHSATLQSTIADSSSSLFANRGMPGGILSHPGFLSDEDALALKESWQTGFTGANSGKVAVLADGLKFEALTGMTALNAQLSDQLKWTVEDIARAFHYPLSKLAGPSQPYTKPEQSNVSYYQDCLQIHLEWIEAALLDGLSLPKGLIVEFDIDNLMRMDMGSLMETLTKSTRILTLNEQRLKLNEGPIQGGDTVYLQDQDHSVVALDKRDKGPDPFGSSGSNPQRQLAPAPEPEPAEEPEERGMNLEHIRLKAKDILWQMSRRTRTA